MTGYIADTFNDDPHGTDEGDTCGRSGCQGVIEFFYEEECSCSASNAPCWACENSFLTCPECGWEA